MLKCEIERGTEVRIEAKGGLVEILSDICHLIDDIYDTIKKRDEATAEAFRRALTEALRNEDSGMWKERDREAGAVQICAEIPKKK